MEIGVKYDDLKDKLAAYAEAHKSIPVFNEAQRVTQDVAVSIGEMRWTDAIKGLKELQSHMGSAEEWKAYAHEGLERQTGIEPGERGPGTTTPPPAAQAPTAPVVPETSQPAVQEPGAALDQAGIKVKKTNKGW